MQMDKTPISVLQDFATRLELTVSYQLCSVEGVVHAPKFVYRVIVGDIVAEAQGQSKKKAKHAAALTALNLLLDRPELETKANEELVANLQHFIGSAEQKKGEEEVETSTKVDSNPVGKLQELCMRRKWPPPHYDKSEEMGLPHERVFTMECAIENLDLFVTGTGRSKKVAKRKAAEAMLDCLAKQGLYDPNAQDKPCLPEPLPEKFIETEDLVKDRIDNLIAGITLQLRDPCDEFDLESELKNSQEASYAKLEFLADGIGCPLKMLSFPKPSKSGNAQVFIQLLSPTTPYLPLVSGWGSGKTREEAKEDAAKRTLTIMSSVVVKDVL